MTSSTVDIPRIVVFKVAVAGDGLTVVVDVIVIHVKINKSLKTISRSCW